MAAQTPIPRNPTNSDLARGLDEQHACLEGAREDIASLQTQMANLQKDFLKEVDLADERHRSTVQYQDLMIRGLRLDPGRADDGRGRTVSTMSVPRFRWSIIATAAATVTAVLTAWQWAGKLWPVALETLRAANHAITGL